MAKILVVDDEVGIRELLRKALDREGYEVITVSTAKQSLELIFKEPFDLILLDVKLSPEDSGISILQKIREFQKKVPVVIYSGVLTPELEKEARLAGADEVLSKDIDILQLVAQLGKIIKAKYRLIQQPSEKKEKFLLIVDDEEGIRRVLREFFRRKGYNTLEAQNGEEALQVIRSDKISVVLLDIQMPGMDGLTTLTKLLEINPKLAVVMTTGMQDEEKVKKAIELGAYCYILKPFDFLYLELVVMSRLIIAESN
jgi:two-component system response regulator (stage 0 sporulation protein F)